MKPRVLAALLAAANILSLTTAHAQVGMGYGQVGFGYGLQPAMQQCVYPNGVAQGAVSDDDGKADLIEERKELNKRIREINRELPKLEREREEYRKHINAAMHPAWAQVVIEHMDYGKNCCINQPPDEGYSGDLTPVPGDLQPVPVPQPQPPPQPAPQPAPAPQPGKQPTTTLPDVEDGDAPKAAPRPRQQPRRQQRNGTSTFDPENQARMPAASEVRAGTSVGGAPNGFPPDHGGGAGGGGGYGGNTLCYDGEQAPYYYADWLPEKGGICRPNGGIDPRACKPPFNNPGSKSSAVSDCIRAIDEYRRNLKKGEELQEELRQAERRVKDIGRELKDLARERKELEADCPDGSCYKRPRRSGGGGGSGPSFWETVGGSLLTTMAPMALGAGVGYLADRQAQKSFDQMNINNQKMGWPAQNYGYPFANTMAGLQYGAIAGARAGAFGCSPTMAGGGPFSPYGAYGPYTNGMNGNMFGYPGLPGYPMLGGGMYNPGAFPFANGPWGNSAMSPFLGGGFPGAGFPGAGFPGGIAGVPGLGGNPAFGGFPGAMPGQFGVPGLGGGIPGLPGMYGNPAMGGIPGYGGYPGLAGQLYPGMTGFGNGLGMPGYGGGLGVGYGPQFQQMQQAAAIQMEMNRRSMDNNYQYTQQYLSAYQGLISAQMKLSQIQSGFTGLSGSYGFTGLGGGYGGYGGGIGLGISLMPSVGTPSLMPISPTSVPPTTVSPTGRTR